MTGRYIYAFWHENLMLPLSQYARPDIHVLISKHADGQIVAKLARHLGFAVVHGSTTRHSVEAVRQMLRLGQNAHLAVTPDGRGPPPGANGAHLPCFAHRPAHRARRHRVPPAVAYAQLGSLRRPPPFHRHDVRDAEPIAVAADADRARWKPTASRSNGPCSKWAKRPSNGQKAVVSCQ